SGVAARRSGGGVMFTEEQKAILSGKLDPEFVKTRKGPNGRTLSYIEGWHVFDVANYVFGYDGWDLETTSMVQTHEPVHVPPDEQNLRGGVVCGYTCRVRLTVYNADHTMKIVRERTGGHRGIGPTVAQCVEDTQKAAETDAAKRCFVTFGN